ncbi:MAG TPA: DUF4124 domain-containing protein [Steroidobacteraceae bacterium]|jgi:hypothetical protein|nr:DUF4124 domain-containing protein [Steroidobacteraceae bacterium]
MSRISTVVWALALTGVAAVATAETVYKWVDSGGQIHYTDLPPRQGDARILGVYQQEAGTVDEEAGGVTEEGSDDSAGSPPEQPTTPEPPPSEAAERAAAADAAKAKVEQCKKAQDRYETYLNSRRLFRETPDGKREYLTDKELSDARARAKQAVDDYCS